MRFRAGLAELTNFGPGASLTVTASVGIAGVEAGSGSSLPDDPVELLRQADQALYQAKRSGRDAIWVHDPSLGGPTLAVASGAPVEPV
jgi:PleD family two-component response regulator